MLKRGCRESGVLEMKEISEESASSHSHHVGRMSSLIVSKLWSLVEGFQLPRVGLVGKLVNSSWCQYLVTEEQISKSNRQAAEWASTFWPSRAACLFRAVNPGHTAKATPRESKGETYYSFSHPPSLPFSSFPLWGDNHLKSRTFKSNFIYGK